MASCSIGGGVFAVHRGAQQLPFIQGGGEELFQRLHGLRLGVLRVGEQLAEYAFARLHLSVEDGKIVTVFRQHGLVAFQFADHHSKSG